MVCDQRLAQPLGREELEQMGVGVGYRDALLFFPELKSEDKNEWLFLLAEGV
jgi:hypothetical protein